MLKPKRKNLRFQTDDSLAEVDITLSGDFKFHYHALVINESYSGACLVTRSDQELRTGLELRVKVGNLGVMPAKVVWVESLDNDVVKFGIEYQK